MVKLAWLFIIAVAALDTYQFWLFRAFIEDIELNQLALWIYRYGGILGIICFKVFSLSVAGTYLMWLRRTEPKIANITLGIILVFHIFLLGWVISAFHVIRI